jgi:WD40 repeat protein
MQPRVNTSEMDFDIAITCLHYLSFPCFDPKLADEAISVLLFRGYYSFQDFATAYWSDYLCSCTSSKSLSPAQVERLASALDKLINRYFIHERQTGELLDENSMFRDLNRSRIIRQLQALRPTSNSSTVVPKSSAKYEITSLHGQLQRRRLIFESSINKLSSNDPHRFNLTIYYGDAEGWFKCPKEQCFAFYEGFTSAESRDQHHKKHLRPHLCSYSGCIYATLGFTNFNELKRHQSNAHPILLEEAAVEFPHSETPLTGHKNKMTKLSSDGQSLEESLDILMDSREEEFEFPAPDVAKSTLSGHEVVMPDATPLLDKPGTELPISYEPNINSPLFRPILDEHRGKPPTSSSRKFAPGTRGPPPLNTIKSLITDLRLFKFDHIGTYPPAGYTARMSAEEKWIAVSTSKTPRQADALDVDLRFTFQHESVVATVCFSPDGKFIATGGNKVARWFSTIDGSVLHSFVVRSTDSVKDNFCRSVCFNPNARLLVTAWEDKIIRILIVRTGFLTGQLKGHDQDIYDIDIGRDGCTMVSGSGDRTARVWDIWTHQEKMILSHKDGVVCVSISTDSARVATGGLDKAIWIWDLTTGNLLKKLLAHTDCIYCIRFTPDNQFLVSGSLDKTLLSWNVGPLGTDKPLTRFEGHNVSRKIIYYLVSQQTD